MIEGEKESQNGDVVKLDKIFSQKGKQSVTSASELFAAKIAEIAIYSLSLVVVVFLVFNYIEYVRS